MVPNDTVDNFQRACEMAERNHHGDHYAEDEEIRYTRHTPKWWETWVNPTTIMVLFGAIVWGVQLNFSVLQNTKEIGYLGSSQQKILQIQQDMVVQNTKTAVILERITQTQDRMAADGAKLDQRIRDIETGRRPGN